MIHIQLQPHYEKLAAPESYAPASFTHRPLYHQIRTWQAFRSYPIVMNTYNTGTGKTQASLLPLLDRRGENVLFIAPTNALIDQHAADIQAFVTHHELDYRVLTARAADITALPSEDNLRRGELLHRLIQNYREFEQHISQRQPIIMVTNPDIFYYAMYFGYGTHDQRNLFTDFVTQFNYWVIDEFHYYNNKQIANFMFALTLFDQFGYFDTGSNRRVCLLSATPRDNVRAYLDALFDNRMALISPHNEPPESAALATVATLAPLKLTLLEGNIVDWAEHHPQDLTRWINDEQQDGVLISGSLARINRVYQQLVRVFFEAQIGRITGPEDQPTREQATLKPLILATPTVDIGYNFSKPSKRDRQSIDFVVSEARFQDELVQRIGRAGRVLGKSQIGVPSHAIVVLKDEDALRQLKPLNGQTLSRYDFNRWLATHVGDVLPQKHQLTGYLEEYALVEMMRPIMKTRQIMPSEHDHLFDDIYNRLCDLFAPSAESRRWQFEQFHRAVNARQRWLDAVKQKPKQPPPKTLPQIADWLYWMQPEDGRYEPRQLPAGLTAQIWSNDRDRTGLIAFVESQQALSQGIFSFRDSFNGPQAAVYDPKRLLSSQLVNTHDVFHLLSNYRLRFFPSQRAFQHETGESVAAAYYVQLIDFRKHPLRVTFILDTDHSRDDFDTRWARVPTAVKGLRIQLIDSNNQVVDGAAQDAENAFQDDYLVALIVPSDNTGMVYRKLRNSGLYGYDLTVNFGDGDRDEGYKLYIGLAAYETYSELKRHFQRLRWKDRRAIIC